MIVVIGSIEGVSDGVLGVSDSKIRISDSVEGLVFLQ